MGKFYINSAGFYVGAFDGATPPAGSIEIASPPPDVRMKWDGTNWTSSNSVKSEMKLEKRKYEYNKGGATIEKMVVALWERVVEGKPQASDAIEVIRQKVKTDNP